MKIKRFISSRLESNGYVIYQDRGGPCYVIDPGYRHKDFLGFAEKNELHIKGILLTHHHYDHTGAVKNISRETGCPVYIHKDDLDMYGEEAEPIEDGHVFHLDGEKIVTIHTPGHTKGGVCFFSEKSRAVFTGDTVFNVDLGRTDLEDGDPKEMKMTIKNIVDKWSNDIEIYPGHGDPCSMKYVRDVNTEFKEALKD